MAIKKQTKNQVAKIQTDAFLKRMKAFKPASEVLKEVKFLPTCFPQVNHAIKLGGWPLGRFAIIHGPSHSGKTMFLIGLMGSFLSKGYPVLFLDLERTTPNKWVESIIGYELANSPLFTADKPDTLEETRDIVKAFIDSILEAKKNKEVPEDFTGLVAIDSISKLVPKKLFDDLLSQSVEKIGMDGMNGMGGMKQANLNRMWLNQVIPDLDRSEVAMVAIGRETVDPHANPFLRKFKQDYKLGGGAHLFYDASLVCRIEHKEFIYNSARTETLAERHKVTIRKSKVASKEGKVSVAYFHSFTGNKSGFDKGRDLFELGEYLGVITSHSTVRRYFPGDEKSWVVNKLIQELNQNPEKLKKLEDLVQENFNKEEPIEESFHHSDISKPQEEDNVFG